MKKVITGVLLEEKIKEAVISLCDVCAMTLGPVCGNVLINESEESPYITNDGVTIASHIESDDPIVNAILDIAKEATLKTNELVGDGTTTTLVLLKYFYLEGLNLIKNGKKRIILKREMEQVLEKVINCISSFKRIPSLKDLDRVASVSSSSSSLGSLVAEVFQKVNGRGAIRVFEGNSAKTYYEIHEGYSLDIESLPDYYFMKNKEIILENCGVLLFHDYLDNIELISDILNEYIIRQKKLLIILDGASDEVKNIFSSFDENTFIYLVEIPNYFSLKYQILKDLEVITGSRICGSSKKICFEDIKEVSMVRLNQENVLLSINDNDEVGEYVSSLKDELLKIHDDYQKEILEERIAKLQNGIAFLYVGGITKTERREKMMRVEDALWALESSRDGVLNGAGVSFLKASSCLDLTNDVEKLFYNVLQRPFEQIMENAGINFCDIKSKIIENDFQVVYDVIDHTFKGVENCNIIDPYKVIIHSLLNALSISSMLLTTEALVICLKDDVKTLEL